MNTALSTPLKPQLRGVLHQISFFVALAAGVWLLLHARNEVFWGCVAYVFSLCGQFAVSALYHRPTWGPKARQWWRRLDHSFIMVLIAGTGSPLALALPADSGRAFLTILWAGAALGVLRAMVWITAPKPVAAILALAFAWFMFPFMPALKEAMGETNIVWFLGGGIIYSIGAVTYALKKPDPWPKVFGYHEVFHTFVVVGAMCHFVMEARVALGLTS